MATNRPYYIDPPPPPVRSPGLFDVGLGPMPFPVAGAVGGGVTYIPDSCGDVFLWDMQCPPVSGAKTFLGLAPAVSGDPFTVYTSYTCSIVGFDYAEASRRVRTRHQLQAQTGVERRFWSGGPAPGAFLTGLLRGATTLTAASCPILAVAELEQALADNGVDGGIIHARPFMMPYFANLHLLEKSGRGWMTPLGTQIVFGQGYDGTGPAGQAVTATTEWMYATGRVPIWVDSEVFVPPVDVLNRVDNTLSLVAEQVYAVGVECGAWAVQVTRDCTTV